MLSPCLGGMFFELHDQAAFERCVVLAVCCVALAALKRYVTSHVKVDGNSLNGVQLLRLDSYCISGAHTATSCGGGLSPRSMQLIHSLAYARRMRLPSALKAAE